MHDVIRDMSLWIACKCEEEKWRFFVQAGYQLTRLPEVRNWGSIHRMSLMWNKIENLVEALDCPDLQTLFLNENQLKVINNDFFQFMYGLKVLGLSDNRCIVELPVGISKLLSLECLDLSNTRIRQLPIELKALEKLKCMNLESLGHHIRIPRQLISAFLKLQVLRMKSCYYSLGQEVEDNSECLVDELKCLNHLNVLTVTITINKGEDGVGRRRQNAKSTEPHSNLSVCKRTLLPKPSHCNDRGMFKIDGHNMTNPRSKPEAFECINERKLSQVAELVETLSLFAKLESLCLQWLPELKSIYWDTLPSRV
ncbi:hypothetical protein CRYUN_Cryun37aG0034600 [Craigia yunnanensis]